MIRFEKMQPGESEAPKPVKPKQQVPLEPDVAADLAPAFKKTADDKPKKGWGRKS